MSSEFKFPTPTSITNKNTLAKSIDAAKAKRDLENTMAFQEKIKEDRIAVAIERIKIKDGIKGCVKEISGIDKQIEEAKKLIANLNQQREVLAKRGNELTEKLSAINPESNYGTPDPQPQPITPNQNPKPEPTPFEPQIQKPTNPQNPGSIPQIPQPAPTQIESQLGPAFQPQSGLKITEPTISQIPGNPTPTIPNNIFGVNFPQRYQQGQDNKGPGPIPNFNGENLMPNPPHPTTNFTLEK